MVRRFWCLASIILLTGCATVHSESHMIIYYDTEGRVTQKEVTINLGGKVIGFGDLNPFKTQVEAKWKDVIDFKAGASGEGIQLDPVLANKLINLGLAAL